MRRSAQLPDELWRLIFHRLWHRPVADNPMCLRDVRLMTCVCRAWRVLCADAPGGSCCVREVDGGLTFCTTHERSAIEVWRSIWQQQQHSPGVSPPLFVHPPKGSLPSITNDILQNVEMLRCVEARASDAIPLRFLKAWPWPGRWSGIRYEVRKDCIGRREESWQLAHIVWSHTC